MNRKECKRLALISEVSGARMTLGHAAVELGLSGRQIRRLVSRYRQLGAAGLDSGHRGKRSNNAIRSALKEEILGLVRGRYQGHGPTWVRRKLAGTHEVGFSFQVLCEIGDSVQLLHQDAQTHFVDHMHKRTG